MTARDVAVLLGGPSAEHDVSLVSGRAIATALDARGHRVEGWLIDLRGCWWRLPPAQMDASLPSTAYDDPVALGAQGPWPAGAALERLAAADPQPSIFIALHGPFGEDGSVQALCEAYGLVYTGCGVAASALGMHKGLFKRLAAALDLPVVPWIELHADATPGARDAHLAAIGTFAAAQRDRRVIVKPARLGSSVGVTVVHRTDELGEVEYALAQAFRYDDTVLVEAYLAGARELEASVVGNDPATIDVYGPGEIFPGHEFYDFAAKYQQGVSRTTATPALDPPLRDTVRALAAQAYRAIGAQGFARVDLLLDASEPYISEINTIPGFTPISLFPVLCAEGGYDFGEIAERIVELALERDAHRPDRRLTRTDLP